MSRRITTSPASRALRHSPAEPSRWTARGAPPAFSASSARRAGAAGASAPVMLGKGRRSPSGWHCPRSSDGCSPSAGSTSTTRRGSWCRACATSCPSLCICAIWSAPSNGSSVRCASARRSPSLAITTSTAPPPRPCWCAFSRRSASRRRFYVPDRLREGYGPNTLALLRLHAAGARVVVTVDCGTTAHLPLAEAAEAGLDVIVVDHHVAEPVLPRAVAVVNPNRLDEESPHGNLAAVGWPFCSSSRSTGHCARPAGMPATVRSPICSLGSTWWRSARCATSSRSPG